MSIENAPASKPAHPPATALHHIGLVCQDLQATHHFYEEVLGFPLVYAEMTTSDDKRSWLKHAFYDLGDGSCIAFFELHNVGEPDELRTDISTGLGLPDWANHIAIRATPTQVAEVRARLEAADIPVEHEMDHDWCASVYVTDPNGILIELTVDTPGFHADRDEALQIINAPAPTPAAESQPA